MIEFPALPSPRSRNPASSNQLWPAIGLSGSRQQPVKRSDGDACYSPCFQSQALGLFDRIENHNDNNNNDDDIIIEYIKQVIHSTIAHHLLSNAPAFPKLRSFPWPAYPKLYTKHEWNIPLASLGQVCLPTVLPVYPQPPHWWGGERS